MLQRQKAALWPGSQPHTVHASRKGLFSGFAGTTALPSTANPSAAKLSSCWPLKAKKEVAEKLNLQVGTDCTVPLSTWGGTPQHGIAARVVEQGLALCRVPTQPCPGAALPCPTQVPGDGLLASSAMTGWWTQSHNILLPLVRQESASSFG